MSGTNSESIPYLRYVEAGKKYRRLAQVCEIASILIFTGWLVLLYSQPEWLAHYFSPVWLFLFVLFLFFLFLVTCTVLCTYRANYYDLRVTDSTRYVVTLQRINTLKAAGVGEDVRAYLQTIVGENFPTQEDFLARLKKHLGPERTDEVKATVLKYTKDYKPEEKKPVESPAPAQAQTITGKSSGKKNSPLSV